MKTLKCLDCDGSGRVVARRWGLGLLARKYQTCSVCDGTGNNQAVPR